MNDPDDPIGTEPGATEWMLLGYFVFGAIVFFVLGLLFGAYVV